MMTQVLHWEVKTSDFLGFSEAAAESPKIMVTGECREQGKVEREWDLGPRGLDAMLRNSDLTL